MKLSDQQRKAMFARLEQHVKEQNYDGLQRWYKQNEMIYGKDKAEQQLFRKFQTRDRKIKEFGSVEAWRKDRQDKSSASYHKAGVTRQKKAHDKYDAKIIAKYGSHENHISAVIAKEKIMLAEIKRVKENPKVAKEVSRKYALTGSKYYKLQSGQGMDSIHCPNCSQRLGNMMDACPICPRNQSHDHYSVHIYGKMLDNPADPRWQEPAYRNNKFKNYQFTGSEGYTNQPSTAEYFMRERQKDAGDLSDLK